MKARSQNASPELCAKTLRVHEILCEEYGCPIAYFHTLDPLDLFHKSFIVSANGFAAMPSSTFVDGVAARCRRRPTILVAANSFAGTYERGLLSELISSLLSHRTKNADSSRAFQNLRAQFPDWSQVLAAPLEQIESAISPCTWPEQKAPRVQQVLAAIENERGALNENVLDFLGEMEISQARAWLEKLPGVGPKTSAAVLAFSRLRGRALPVDSHHHRVAARLGLIEAKIAVGPSHAILENLLPQDWDAQQVYDHHEVLMLHGQKCCFFNRPNCARCVVREECDFYARQLSVD